ncbi:MAG: hypothetical protein NWF09_01750 [Candidatus Bathyarchaeota archaeon]|nr:hypothetical protein [Candidatus Bathyarchaeota archaeon]
MTRHPPDEIAPKCPVDLEEAYKVRAGAVELLEKNTLAICGADPAVVAKADVAAVVVQEKTEQSELEKIMSELYDLEDCAAQEKPLKIDLDLNLYQMETP